MYSEEKTFFMEGGTIRQRGAHAAPSPFDNDGYEVYYAGQEAEEERDPPTREELINEMRRKQKNLESNFWSCTSVAFLMVVIILCFIWGSYIYIWLHGHTDIDKDISSLEMRIDGLNITGLDDIDPDGLCLLLEENVEFDCLKDVVAVGASEGDLITLSGSTWVAEHRDDICPVSCINGTDGAVGIPGINGTDGIDGIDGINGTNGVDGVNGTDGADGADGAIGPAGPIVPLCNLTDVYCGVSDVPGNCTVLKYDENTDQWNSTDLTYDIISGDLCVELGGTSIDCLSDVAAASPTDGMFLMGNGVNWVPGTVNFTTLTGSICVDSESGLELDCLDNVNTAVNGSSVGHVLKRSGADWVSDSVEYSELGGNPEPTALKGIGGGRHFSSHENQTRVLNPSVLGTVDFTGGEAYLDISVSADDLNGAVMIPFVGNDFGTYIYEVFYYNAGASNVTISFYEYSLADMNTGSVAGTLIGNFTTTVASGYGIDGLFVSPTVTPAMWVIQTTVDDVYIKSIM